MEMSKPFAAIALIPLLPAIVFLAGCDSHARHRALNFFFTGVPPLEAEKGPEENAPEQTRDKPRAAVGMRSAHSYFTGNQCSRCHQVSMAFGGGRGVWKPAAPAAVAAPSLPPRTPDLGICLNCHENPFEAAGTHAPRPHAPVECRVCHLPHQSEHPSLLRSEDSEICAICHLDEKRSGAGFHRAPLRRDFTE